MIFKVKHSIILLNCWIPKFFLLLTRALERDELLPVVAGHHGPSRLLCRLAHQSVERVHRWVQDINACVVL